MDLVAVTPLGKMIILVLGFDVLGNCLAKVGPRTPNNRVRLGKCGRTHLEVAPDSNDKPISRLIPGPSPKLKFKMAA